jgi:hypothetical protein
MKTQAHDVNFSVKHVTFTDPRPRLDPHFRPEMRTPILTDPTDAIELERLGRSPVLDPNRAAVLNNVRLAQLAIEDKAKTLPGLGTATSEFGAAGTGFLIR